MSNKNRDAATLLHKVKLAVMLRDLVKMNANKKELAKPTKLH